MRGQGEGGKEGRKRKERKRLLLLLLCVSLSVCLPTNTLSSPFPPSLAPSLEFSSIQSSPVRHKLRATLLCPISPSLPPPFRNQRLRNCGLLFQKSALRRNRRPVTIAASGFAYHYLQHHSTYPVVLRHPTAAEKGGIADRLFGAGDKTLATLPRQ